MRVYAFDAFGEKRLQVHLSHRVRQMADNKLYYGDNLDVLRRHITDESVDLIYLKQVALARFILADKCGDVPDTDQSRVMNVSEVGYLKLREFHLTIPEESCG